MSPSLVSLRSLCAAALLLAAPALHAGAGPKGHGDHEGHDHAKHDHAVDSAAAGTALGSLGSHGGMSALYRHLGEMEQELAAGNLAGIHGHDEAIQAAVRGLDTDTSLTEAKRKRVQGYAKNVQRLSGKMHAAADGKKLDQVKADFAKLKAQVDLLDKQFGHSHKPGTEKAGKTGKHGAAHSHPHSHPHSQDGK